MTRDPEGVREWMQLAIEHRRGLLPDLYARIDLSALVNEATAAVLRNDWSSKAMRDAATRVINDHEDRAEGESRLEEMIAGIEDVGPPQQRQAPRYTTARALPAYSNDHRLRRSRIDWIDYLPVGTACAQMTFEREATALAMRRAGFLFKEIGKRLGVSTNRARQIVERHRRRLKGDGMSPAEYQFSEMGKAPRLTAYEADRLRGFFSGHRPKGWKPSRLDWKKIIDMIDADAA